jgi:hypothetical protein
VISTRKLAAVRANGRRSSGPRTPEGRARASANALHHGLSLPAMADPGHAADACALARRIAGGRADLLDQALAVAAAQVDLARVRRLRHARIATALHDLAQAADNRAERIGTKLDEILAILSDIKGRTTSSSPTIARLQQISALRAAAGARHEDVSLTAMIAALARLDRYERLCLARRKTAIRRFDDASL